MDKFWQRNRNNKKKQIEIIELKNKISEIKNKITLGGLKNSKEKSLITLSKLKKGEKNI